MPFIASPDGTRLNVTLGGARGQPPVLLAHSIGCDHRLWENQVSALRDRYWLIAYDARGHGLSDAPAGDYRVEQLAQDALSILDALGIDAVHFCGLSLGGTVGQWLALYAPHRLHSLTLADTAARLGTPEGWQARMDAALAHGTASIADMSMTRFFSDIFRQQAPIVVERFRQGLIATADQGFAGCAATLRDCNFRDELKHITTPTLVICGRQDVPTPPSDSAELVRGISGAGLVLLEGGHLSAVENPAEFSEALASHIDAQGEASI